MAIELAYNEAYATADEADVFLSTNDTWLGLADHIKDDSLLWSRYYLDENFDCYLSTLDVIPEELKYANSLLAADFQVSGTLYVTSSANTGIKKTKVKAGDVETEKEYFEGTSSSTTTTLPPSIRQVRALLAPLCKSIYGTGTVNLVRA